MVTRSEKRICQNCKSEFVVDSGDFAFYEKIGVPAPTWCPECRTVRRILFRNERTLYKRLCDLCGANIISMYHAKTAFPVYCHTCWWSDKWDVKEYRQDYDFKRSFFEQFKKLYTSVPRVALLISGNSVRSEYTNIVQDLKDCFYVMEADYIEDSAYTGYIQRSKSVFDSNIVFDAQRLYDCISVQKSNGVISAQETDGCMDSYFLKGCASLQSCLGCVNLRRKSYHIFNEPYLKEQYKVKVEGFDLGSYNKYQKLRSEFADFSKKFPRKYADIRKSVNVTGDLIYNSAECVNCFGLFDVRNGKNLIWSGLGQDYMDCYGSGYHCQLLYECQAVYTKMYDVRFSNFCFKGGRNIQYSEYCAGAEDIFGCIGLRGKRYCILNKQYTKEEYEKVIPKIIEQMGRMPYQDKKGRVYGYGEFFPPELSPFAYNETTAQEYFPLSKNQALEKGYSWKDPEKRDYAITMTPDQLPDHIKDVNDSILNQTVGCAHAPIYRSPTSIDSTDCNEQCATAFKVIPQELIFYKDMNLPLPRLCPNCRHYQRLKQRNPLKLWHRKCMCGGSTSDNGDYTNTANHSSHSMNQHCSNEFETSYAPERPEIVYCEKCYQAEVA